MYHALLGLCSAGGLTFAGLLIHSARPDHLRRIGVPALLDGPITLDSDVKGLIL